MPTIKNGWRTPSRIRFAAYVTIMLALFVSRACATFSIVAIDTVTGEVGSAGASCIADCRIIDDLVIGVGAIHTQSYFMPGNQHYAHRLLMLGLSAADIIDSLSMRDVTNNSSFRQYGVVNFAADSGCAAFTGANCTAWAGHRVGATYAIQGNILLSAAVLDTMEWAFLNTQGSLAQKLLAALEAAKIPGADTRCEDLNKSTISAFLRVARPEDSPHNMYCDLYVPNTSGNTDPIDLLREQYEQWEINRSLRPAPKVRKP